MAKTPEFDLRRPKKNFIINGDMRIAQRNTTFTSPADGAYTLDRWRYGKSASCTHTVTQDTDVPTLAQSGYLFQNSLRMNLTGADTSIAAGDIVAMAQYIEGYNWASIAQKSFTISFWVKATLPGIYCVGLRNSARDRAYVSEYTINSANTWEYKTIIVSASPSDGTWNYINGVGLEVNFVLAVGTTFQTTAGTWQTGNFLGTANQVNGVNTGATDFRLTGVCLNEGTDAMAFKTYGVDFVAEIAACQRYYEKSYDFSAAPGAIQLLGMHWITGATAIQNYATTVRFCVTKRSLTYSFNIWDGNGNAGRVTNMSSAGTATHNVVNSGAGGSGAVENGYYILVAPQTTPGGSCGFHWVADAEL